MNSKRVHSALSVGLMKAGIFLVMFSLLHFLYDWLPVPLMAVFASTDESFLQHAKIGFWAYACVSAGELLVFNKRISNKSDAVFARLLATYCSRG